MSDQQKCPECGGPRKTIMTCPACNGSGKVPSEKLPADLIDRAATVPSEDTCPYCGTDQCESIDHWTAQTDYWWRVSEEWRERSEKAEARGVALEKTRWKARIEKLAKVEDRDVEFCRVVNGNRSKAAVHKGRARLLRSLLNDPEGADHE